MAIAFVLAGGCGLSDYEKRMDEQRDRLNLIDEENAALGDLIDMPSGKDPYGGEIKVPFEIFLRVPKGVSGAFQERDSLYVFEKQLLVRYIGNKTDVNVFAAWARIAEKDAKTKPKEDEVLPEDFHRRVRGALMDFIARTGFNANPPNFNQANKDPRQVLRDGKMRKLDLESLAFDDPRPEPQRSRFLVYFLTWNDRQGAVVYQVPLKDVGQYTKGVDISLRTLEIANIAQAQRAAFRTRKK
jgi:hypothetical protein